ncbi:HK97 family phage prohead protease [Duganella sp. FT94W]|uniref:HK97 family phage prohead protease n=1 Tax=Duganella lactea TaxID=2692173 RepID=A0ABW9VF54_9BURK|nr:HK97 family phage prohead protease [Duganella lactea]MYM37254.1 HK97 family phage prohead protease [Duganella lactea]
MERKLLALTDVQLKMADDGGSFTGYVSTFGNVDSYGDTIIKGAYAETLKENGLPKMFFNHNSYQVPIGKWIKAEEDDYGLLMSGEFTPGIQLAQEVRAAMKHGTLDSFSIGYSLTKGDYDETTQGRTIRKVKRLAETSIVIFPADKFAKVDETSIKSFGDEIASIETIRDFEYFLRDAGSFSKGAAQALTARAKSLFGARDAAKQEEVKYAREILDRIKRLGE